MAEGAEASVSTVWKGEGMTARPFTGLVEALPPEEWAVRLRVSLDHFKKHYKGPVAKIGANARIYSCDIHDWLLVLTGRPVVADGPDPWAGVGDAEEGALSGREPGKAA